MKKIVLLISVMSVFFANGCGIKGNVDIRIVEVGSMLRYDVSPRGVYRETILSINEDKKCFYTLQQFGNKILKLRTRDFNGKETRLQTMPLFSQFYYYPGNTISPDGRNFVYLDKKDRSIKVYNLDSKTTDTLLANASAYTISIQMMEFISNDTMIIALDEDEEIGRRECQIIKYNLRTKTHSVLSRPVRLLMFTCAFSPEKTKMAYTYIDNNKIRIVDLVDNSGTPETILGEEKEGDIHLICWSPDGNKIGYVCKKTIKVFDIQSKTTKNVKTFASNLLCYKLKFTDNEHLIYLLGGAGEEEGLDCMDQPLRILEIATGRDVKKIENFESNGDLFVVEKGKRIIGEVGF